MGTNYYFDSFGNSSATEFLDSGTVTTTGQEQGDYVEVKVTANNSHPDFVGANYWIVGDAETDGSVAYQLYTDAGTTGTGMYVKIYETAPTRTVSFTVNDGTDPIQGATVTIGDVTKTTGSSGGCTATLNDGAVEIEVAATGYETETETITVAYDEVSFTISLTATTP